MTGEVKQDVRYLSKVCALEPDETENRCDYGCFSDEHNFLVRSVPMPDSRHSSDSEETLSENQFRPCACTPGLNQLHGIGASRTRQICCPAEAAVLKAMTLGTMESAAHTSVEALLVSKNSWRALQEEPDTGQSSLVGFRCDVIRWGVKETICYGLQTNIL